MKRDEQIDAELKALEMRKAKLLKIAKLRREIRELEFSDGAVAYSETIKVIITEVCAKFGLTHDLLLSRCREDRVAGPRQVAYYITRQFDEIPYCTIAQAFGKEHGTIMFGCRAVQNRMDTEPSLKSIVEGLIKVCREKQRIATETTKGN